MTALYDTLKSAVKATEPYVVIDNWIWPRSKLAEVVRGLGKVSPTADFDGHAIYVSYRTPTGVGALRLTSDTNARVSGDVVLAKRWRKDRKGHFVLSSEREYQYVKVV